MTKRGYQFERETAALAGEHGKRMPRSGGYGTEGFVTMCGDVQFKFPWMSGKVISIECKHGYSDKGQERKSMRIDRAWFEKHMKQSKMGDFLPAWAMKFRSTHENGMSKFVMVPFSTMKEIINEMENVYSELQELRDEQKKRKKATSNR